VETASAPVSEGDDQTRKVLLEVKDQLREMLTLLDRGAKKVN
jgi:hypothetical protein